MKMRIKSISKVGMWSLKEKNLADPEYSRGEGLWRVRSVNSGFPGMEVKQMKLKNTLGYVSGKRNSRQASWNQESSIGKLSKQGSRVTQKSQKPAHQEARDTP